MIEIWKPVKGKEEYAEISNYGQIHRFKRVYYCGKNHKSKCIQEEEWTYGYESGEYLYANIGGVKKGVHVWVYMTFNDCDIPEGLQVNHIDEDKHNNRLDNLNLMTPKENTNWGTGNARMAASKSKPVQALNPKTLEAVMEFPSIIEAQRQGFSKGAVSACCRNCYSTHKGNIYKGFIWRYV